MRASEPSFRATFAILAAWPLALLLAAVSLGGLITDAYARETPAWLAQANGQDWFDLVIATPWIAVCGYFARSSPRWRVLLAGAYAYVIYELFIYVFAVHFNAMFLLYCATLGVASFALLSLIGGLRGDALHVYRRGARLGGATLVGLGIVFTLLWLSEVLPAVLTNTPPASLAETGLLTNPVHAIDLSFVLPAMLVVGASLWRRQRTGELYGPVLLAFGVVMAASIVGMLAVIGLAGGTVAVPVIVALAAIAAATALVLACVLNVSGRRAGRAYRADRSVWSSAAR